MPAVRLGARRGYHVPMWKTWRRRRILRRSTITDLQWQASIAALPLLKRLAPPARANLQTLATLFLYEKTFRAAGDATLDDATRLAISLQAALPVLNLGLDYYADWRDIVIYPDAFMPDREYMDEAGVVHSERHVTIGEAWLQGPVILAASEAIRGGADDGVNVVLHECAHKLDMLNGEANGFPPLHADMNRRAWTEAFADAYRALCVEVDAGHDDTAIDPYASESPGEFFAVTTEYFFEMSAVLKRTYPAVYTQLAQFYRQDPAMDSEHY